MTLTLVKTLVQTVKTFKGDLWLFVEILLKATERHLPYAIAVLFVIRRR